MAAQTSHQVYFQSAGTFLLLFLGQGEDRVFIHDQLIDVIAYATDIGVLVNHFDGLRP
ncbi:hypothetical protein D3C81_2284220 [compost metagenome]